MGCCKSGFENFEELQHLNMINDSTIKSTKQRAIIPEGYKYEFAKNISTNSSLPLNETPGSFQQSGSRKNSEDNKGLGFSKYHREPDEKVKMSRIEQGKRVELQSLRKSRSAEHVLNLNTNNMLQSRAFSPRTNFNQNTDRMISSNVRSIARSPRNDLDFNRDILKQSTVNRRSMNSPGFKNSKIIQSSSKPLNFSKRQKSVNGFTIVNSVYKNGQKMERYDEFDDEFDIQESDIIEREEEIILKTEVKSKAAKWVESGNHLRGTA